MLLDKDSMATAQNAGSGTEMTLKRTDSYPTITSRAKLRPGSKDQLLNIACKLFDTSPEKVSKVQMELAREALKLYQHGATVRAIRTRLKIGTSCSTLSSPLSVSAEPSSTTPLAS